VTKTSGGKCTWSGRIYVVGDRFLDLSDEDRGEAFEIMKELCFRPIRQALEDAVARGARQSRLFGRSREQVEVR